MFRDEEGKISVAKGAAFGGILFVGIHMLWSTRIGKILLIGIPIYLYINS